MIKNHHRLAILIIFKSIIIKIQKIYSSVETLMFLPRCSFKILHFLTIRNRLRLLTKPKIVRFELKFNV